MEPVPTVLPLDWLKTVVELGSFGLLSWIIYWWVSKEMPKRDAAFLESLSQQRSDCQKASDQERQEYLRSFEIARQDYLAAQQQQRADYLTASRELAKEHWAQLEKQRASYEERARLDREGVEKRAESMVKAIQGLGDVIVGREARNLPTPPGPPGHPL